MAFLGESYREMVKSSESDHKPNAPAPFLTKTYQLVDDSSTDRVISWGEHCTTFIVWRPQEFARDLLPKYFKHNNFLQLCQAAQHLCKPSKPSSVAFCFLLFPLIQQKAGVCISLLKLIAEKLLRFTGSEGFRKIVAERWEFANDFFRKGEKHLLSEIHRRKASQQPQQYMSSPTAFECQGEISSWIELPLPQPNTDSNPFISALSKDNERLRRNNTYLMSELTHMKKLYNDIIYFVQNHVGAGSNEQRMVSSRLCRLVEIDPCGDQTGNCESEMQLSENYESSLKMNEDFDGAVKIFGVSLHGKKGLHSESVGRRKIDRSSDLVHGSGIGSISGVGEGRSTAAAGVGVILRRLRRSSGGGDSGGEREHKAARVGDMRLKRR
ncbi:Heat stress transcription factor B-4 [Platanthera zijinensis]|uniref:Heat stress transcription factor B-4 n=1 Tax=Platanthera zijinensis TaxID=2320716 RepID=A0AAP0B6G7_9ASPA